MRNIGGSILPSSCPAILVPMAHKGGQLVVIPDEEADTHHLKYVKDGDTKVLASHPNGYSCRSLGERIVLGNKIRVKEQAEYIVRCGGSMDWGEIENVFVEVKI